MAKGKMLRPFMIPDCEEEENEDIKDGIFPLDEYHTPKQLMLHTGSSIKLTSASQLASTVSEDLASLKTAALNEKPYALESRVLVLYTGGTIGMKCIDGVYCPEQYYLARAIRELPPLNDKDYITAHYGDAQVKPFCLPPIRHMKKRIVYWVVEYEPLLDSSDMTYDDWIRIGKDIRKAYEQYDGFVVLHGTDTLAYTACALSFMLENLGKPVIITGAQIPVCEVRSDGRENLIGALIIAGNFDIPEVTVFFNNKLLRGNRSTKLDNSALDAFDSPNMAPIAQMEITIKVNYASIYRSPFLAPFSVHDRLCRNVGLLRIFPSISIDSVRAFLRAPTQGVVLQTFGAGNMPSRRTDIIEEIKQAVERGCIVVNCSQCVRGQVDVHYFTGKILYDAGVIPGSDMTAEAALTKLAYVLGKDEWDLPTKRKMIQRNIRGEMTSAHSETLRELEIIPQLAKFLRISSSHEVQLLRNALFPPLLCHAASKGDVDLLENLRESGAILSATDYNGRSALHVAARAGHKNAVIYLLKHGVSVHLRDEWDENPLMSAIRSKNLACIKALRDAGAVPVGNPIDLGVELCLLTSRGDIDALGAWIAAGVDINEKDYEGRTALHVAVCAGNEELVTYLLARGANPEAIDNTSYTPIDEAKRRGFASIL
uniref:asparaginase n=4 Tax=Ascarididae TaxID=6250 RepID=A0A915CJA0_PARUN